LKLSENVEKDYEKVTPYAPTPPPEVIVPPKRKPRNDMGKRRRRIVKYEEEQNRIPSSAIFCTCLIQDETTSLFRIEIWI
jgi:hypothetical protein